MRWPFRREPAGRHALGAAVTAVPAGPAPAQIAVLPPVSTSVPPWGSASVSGSVSADVPVTPAVLSPLPEVAVRPLPEPSDAVDMAPPDAALVDVSLLVPPQARGDHAVVQPLPEPDVLDDAPVQPLPVEDLLVQAPPVIALRPEPEPEPVPVPVELLVEAPVAQAPPPVVLAPGPPAVSRLEGPRVELGFADGTYRMLDPASDTALALAELVGELTGGSPGQVTTPSAAEGSERP